MNLLTFGLMVVGWLALMVTCALVNPSAWMLLPIFLSAAAVGSGMSDLRRQHRRQP